MKVFFGMRYPKFYTYEEWMRFKQFNPKEINGKTYYIDVQEMMCKKYDIIITDWQPKHVRTLNKINNATTKILNGIDKGIKMTNTFVKALDTPPPKKKAKRRRKN